MIENSPYFIRAMTLANTFLILTLLYIVFMDIQLYFRIQNYPLRIEPNSTEYPANCPDYSPLCYVTVKAVMLDGVNLFIFGPLATVFDYVLHISDMTFITPNMISFSHVIIAAVSAKFVSSHLISSRRIGVALFEFRTFLDDLDGHVARTRKHVHGENSDIGSVGFYVDGICDGLGIIFLLLGIYYFLKNNPSRRDYLPLQTSVSEKTEFSEGMRRKLLTKRLMQTMVCVGMQLILTSSAWNRYIARYQDMLERPNVSHLTHMKQLKVFRSNYYLFIALLWGILNIHNYLHVILLAVAYDKLWELFKSYKYIGFVVLLALILLTEIHIIQAEHYIYGNRNDVYNNTSV